MMTSDQNGCLLFLLLISEIMKIPQSLFLVCFALILAASLFLREEFTVLILSVLVPLVLGLAAIAFLAWSDRLSLKTIALTLIGFGGLIAMGVNHLPLKVAFWACEPHFDSLAEELLAGKTVEFPRQVGPFFILEGGIRESSGDPYLRTGKDEYEFDGFARNPTGEGFNLWSITPLGSHWSYLSED